MEEKECSLVSGKPREPSLKWSKYFLNSFNLEIHGEEKEYIGVLRNQQSVICSSVTASIKQKITHEIDQMKEKGSMFLFRLIHKHSNYDLELEKYSI